MSDPKCPTCGAPADWEAEDLLSGEAILGLRAEVATLHAAARKELDREAACRAACEGYANPAAMRAVVEAARRMLLAVHDKAAELQAWNELSAKMAELDRSRNDRPPVHPDS